MKVIFLLVVASVLYSCDNTPHEKAKAGDDAKVELEEIDSSDYILYHAGTRNDRVNFRFERKSGINIGLYLDSVTVVEYEQINYPEGKGLPKRSETIKVVEFPEELEIHYSIASDDYDVEHSKDVFFGYFGLDENTLQISMISGEYHKPHGRIPEIGSRLSFILHFSRLDEDLLINQLSINTYSVHRDSDAWFRSLHLK